MVAGFPRLIMIARRKKMNQQMERKKLDIEWVELMKEAKKMGLKVEDVRVYLANITKR